MNQGDYKGYTEMIPERQLKALRMRQSGLSYRAIGRALEISHVQAWKDVNAVIEQLQKDNLEEAKKVKAIEIARLDVALEAIWEKVEAGDPIAIDRMIKIMERRSRYEGLDAPTKQEIEVATPEPIKFVPAPERVDE
jgi:transcriptional regulator